MARNDKLSPGIQVFRGSRPRQDVFAANAGVGYCPGDGQTDYDKLAERTRFDNSLAHSNPTGANDKFVVPFGDGFADTRNGIVRFINEVGVGGYISVLAIPTYAFVTGVGIHIEAEETGLTFDLETRNGLVLPTAIVKKVETEATSLCEMDRTVADGDANTFKGFGAMGANIVAVDIFGRDGDGRFAGEADELVLKVATMPAGGIVHGTFKLYVSVSYDIIHRAEY